MTEGKKFDSGKPPLGLLPAAALRETAKVLAFGANKYGRDNWKSGLNWSRLYDAALRHLHAFIDGEDLDEESGLSHLAHALCCLMFLYWHTIYRKSFDDRYKEVIHETRTITTTGPDVSGNISTYDGPQSSYDRISNMRSGK